MAPDAAIAEDADGDVEAAISADASLIGPDASAALPAPFDPAQLDGLVLRLEDGAFFADEASQQRATQDRIVRAWKNAATGASLVQSDPTGAPVLRSWGHGGRAHLAFAPGTSLQGVDREDWRWMHEGSSTICLVWRAHDAVAAPFFGTNAGLLGSAGYGWATSTRGGLAFRISTGGSDIFDPTPAPQAVHIGVWSVTCARRDASEAMLDVDRAQAFRRSITPNAATPSGASPAFLGRANVDVAAVLGYARALSDAELESVQGYLDTTYALESVTFLAAASSWYLAYPGIASTPAGTLVVGYRRAHTHGRDWGYIVQRRSHDRGRTWLPEEVVYPDPKLDSRDVGISQLSDGSLAMTFFVQDYLNGSIPNAVRLARSTDDGATWQAPSIVSSWFSSWSACSGRPVELGSPARLTVPIYGQDAGDAFVSSHLVVSTDGGRSWSNEYVIGDGDADKEDYNEPNVLSLGGDDVLALIRGSTSYVVFSTKSADGGKTWSHPVFAFRAIGSPRLTKLSSGRICSVTRAFQNGRASTFCSTDGGASWSGNEAIDADPNTTLYGALVELWPGEVGVAYSVGHGAHDADMRFRTLPEFVLTPP